MKQLLKKLLPVLRRVLAFLLNPRLLLCFGIAWMITNGWCYLFLFFGVRYGIGWMAALGGAYAAFLWFPFTPEKIVTVAIAIFLLRLLFPRDQATLAVLQDEAHRVREHFLAAMAARRARRIARGMHRVLVIGCPGSGKSEFSRALRDITGLPIVYLDRLFWRSDKTTVSQEEFDCRLQQALAEECWIVDGNYQRTLDVRLAAADTVFFLDYPTAVCLDGIRARRGRAREDMPWVEEDEDPELITYVQEFRQKNRPILLQRLSRFPKKRTVTFLSRAQADRFLAALREQYTKKDK